MIVVMQEQAPEEAVEAAISYLVKAGCSVQRSSGQLHTILGVVGEVSSDDLAVVRELDGVAQVVRVSEPFRLASSRFRSESSVLHGDYGTIGGKQPWIALEPVARLAAESDDVAPVSASLPYRIAAGRPFDAAVVRQPVAPDAVGALACLSIHPSPRDARFPLVFVPRSPSWGVEAWIQSAEALLQRGGTGVVLLEAGGEYPNAERTFDVVAAVRAKRRTHLPLVVDVPVIARQLRDVSAVARAAVAAGVDGVVLRVSLDSAGEHPRVPATLGWDAAVELAENLRAIGRLTRA